MEYELNGHTAFLRIDDGKANAVGHSFLDDVNAGLDRAESEAKAVILRGRDGMFSAGFDLKEFQKGPEETIALVRRGFELLHRLYSYPLPLVAACSGHGVAMGAFILLASDSRLGVKGDFRITLPETAIGMDLPPLLMALTTSRVSSRHLTRAAIQAEVYTPEAAIDAGFLDEVVQWKRWTPAPWKWQTNWRNCRKSSMQETSWLPAARPLPPCRNSWTPCQRPDCELSPPSPDWRWLASDIQNRLNTLRRRILLQEMPGALDGAMRHTLAARHLLLESFVTAGRYRVIVGKGRHKRLVELV